MLTVFSGECGYRHLPQFPTGQGDNQIKNAGGELVKFHLFDTSESNTLESRNVNSFDLYSFNNQIYSYMTDKSETHTALNILSLIRLKPECKIMPTRVDFSSPNKPGSTQTSITPAFNNDRCFYTPAFTLPADIKHYHKNLQIEKCQFEEKIQRCLQEATNLTQLSLEEELIAIAPNSNFCQICQERFDHYFIHIQQKSHVIRLAQSDASEKIRNLCLEFQTTETVAQVKGKTKLIKKQQKKEEKKVKGIKSNSSISQSSSAIEGFTTTQNHSTAIIEDIQV